MAVALDAYSVRNTRLLPTTAARGDSFSSDRVPLHPVENRFCSVVFEIMRCVTIRVYSAANITYVGTVIFQLS